MGKTYKLFQSLCYEGLNWSFDKGKKAERKRISEHNKKQKQEERELINKRYFNRYYDKRWNELLEKASKVTFYEDIDDDDKFLF